MPGPRRIGTDEEDRAAEFLANRGLTVVTRRYRGGGGELDVVAFDGDTLVCVEVKSRRHAEHGASEAVSLAKLGRMKKAAAHFLSKFDLGERAVRLDVVTFGPSGELGYFPDVENQG